MKNNTPWKTLASKVIFQNPWLSLRQDDVITPAGKPGSYTLLEAKPFVIIVAMDGDKLIMIRQYRYPINTTTIEFPAGGLKSNEEPLAAAKRELKEETGYEANSWIDMGEFYELVSISRQKGYLFLAQELHDTGNHHMKEDGIEKHISVSPEEFKDMIQENKILDVLTLAAFYKVQLHLTTYS